jgi:alkaline phosphatase D
MGNARLWRADRSTDGSCALRYYNQTPAPAAPKPLPSRIAFGSCAHQDKPQPVLGAVLERKADLFVYLGDNIYGDTRDMDVLRAKYRRLGSKPEFEALRGSVPLLAVWDDHDYGENDAGREYPRKEESKAIFMDFWNVPPDSPRRTHTGIYGAHRYEQDGRALQVILLDTRTFRDPLARRPREGGKPGWKNDYRPESDPARTLLGAEQWAWLEDRLREPADLRILCSSIQFGHEYNGFESWTNLPREQERMIDTIRRTRANGVVFISGDVHWGEISKREIPGGYPLYDVTASGITEDWPDLEGNRHRVGEAVRENHFGMIKIDWAAAPSPVLWLRLVDGKNTVRIEERVELSALRFAEAP